MSLLLESLATILLTALAIRWIISHAPALKLIDEPNHRSAHSAPIPRGAGIAFVTIPLLLFVGWNAPSWGGEIIALASVLPILAIGVLDDRHEAPPKLKFLVIALATLILWWDGLYIDGVGRYFGVDLRLGWLALPFTYFALAGFTNALNLIDGLDGLAGTISLVIFAAFAYLGFHQSDPFLSQVSLLMMAGIVAFLFFNWRPASIFMGDSGSLSLGFLISILSVYSLRYLPSVAVLYLGAIPILDTLVVMIRRKRHGRSATAPDPCHLHHLLLRLTGSVPRTVLILSTAQALFVLVALSMPREMEQAPALVFFFLLVWWLYRFSEHTIEQQKMECYRD